MTTAAITMPGPTKGPAVGRKRTEIDQSKYSGRLAARVRSLREKSRKTVPEMAKAVGVSTMTWYHYEAHRRDIPSDMYPDIAEVFGLSVRQLLPKD